MICVSENVSAVTEAAGRKTIGTSRWTIACLNGDDDEAGEDMCVFFVVNALRKGHLPVSVPAQCSNTEPIPQPCSHLLVSESASGRR